ncbi:MAG TPA: flagellar basal body P-ring protein FlgI, partial [Anaerohalosphaeraceae bacterium]|nr:flagellar basal body P-ring protein FlgI [Anaerohalosphaeraceae bacterium]
MKLQMITVLLIGTTLVLPAGAERIKDIVDIQGIRGNTLEGIGLVVGLANTGDSTLPSRQMLTNILRRSGLVFSSNDLKSGNIAIVSVTAELGPFAREGSRLDVDVSSIGDAKNLQGGTLLMTELYGADGQVYAVARGTVF